MNKDIPVLPELSIVYDPKQREYYNTSIDIFLSEDDITYYKLRPYSQITTPLPSPLPEDYFIMSPTIKPLNKENIVHAVDLIHRALNTLPSDTSTDTVVHALILLAIAEAGTLAVASPPKDFNETYTIVNSIISDINKYIATLKEAQ